MAPELQRFYGGRPQDWARMPLPIAAAYYERIPEMQAREALAQTTVGAMATRNVPEREAQRIHDRWLRQAGWRKPARKLSPADRKAALGAIGIGVTVKPKRKKNV
jgi:hypothetical protein